MRDVVEHDNMNSKTLSVHDLRDAIEAMHARRLQEHRARIYETALRAGLDIMRQRREAQGQEA